MQSESSHQLPLHTMILGSLGVVYGDIGTSPLYTVKECFFGHHAVEVTEGNVLGVISLVLWTLIVIITIKYVVFVLRADNHGEGGVMALMSLVRPRAEAYSTRLGAWVVGLGLFGSALLYGDGVITPAISVLSAVEGLDYAIEGFGPYVLPITLVILVGLFWLQSRGTALLGALFGPVMLAWFIVIGALGIRGILQYPGVLQAVFPWHGIRFLFNGGWHAFLVLGSVFLCTTGGEAMYADMGHFGRTPIRWAWFTVALPGLVLNYFGQGALMLSHPVENPFFGLAPKMLVIPLVLLATFATVIASQALISGAFSLTHQAIQLGYLPRLKIHHTSATHIGQIYIAPVNWLLLVACIGLVLGFRSSTSLAAVYGIAVAFTMVITSLLLSVLAFQVWGTRRRMLVPALVVVLLIEGGFLLANLMKIPGGGWFPLVVGGLVFLGLTTWKRGRELLAARLLEVSLTPEAFETFLAEQRPVSVPGTAVFLTATRDRLPPALVRNILHNHVVHEVVVLLTILTEEIPYTSEDRRLEISRTPQGYWRVVARYGFMEHADVPELLRACAVRDLAVDPETCTYFLARETVLPTERPGMWLWREALFSLMSQNAEKRMTVWNLPPARVIEMGSQVDI